VKDTDMQNFMKEYIQRLFLAPKSTQKGETNSVEMILNIKELSSIIHFPNSKFNKNTRIKWQNYKIVPAPDNIPHEGLLIGYNQSGGIKKEIRLKNDDRFRHFYVLGQTGTGKSTIMLSMAKYDLEKGNGFCMIDPH
jgi:DNA helicase HerA-like ATPase